LYELKERDGEHKDANQKNCDISESGEEAIKEAKLPEEIAGEEVRIRAA